MKARRQDNTLVLAKGVFGAWTPHDLRRTEAGATMMQVVCRLAGHHRPVPESCPRGKQDATGVHAPYMHRGYVEGKREAWRLLGERLDAIIA
jgi:hypothetical protein